MKQRLTIRQLSIIQAAADGRTVKQWARAQGISPDTAKKHLESARFKLGGLKSVTHAVAVCLRQGLIK